MDEELRLTVPDDEDGARVDAFLAAASPLSRNRLGTLIAEGRVLGPRGAVRRASHRVRSGELYRVEIPAAEPIDAQPQAIPLRIVHEDAHLVVVDKAPGMVVHPAPGHDDGTLVNALLHHCSDLSGIGGSLRPGIVHRIDKDTSGLLVVSKDDATHALLQAQFRAHSVRRTYRALCARTHGAGLPEDVCRIASGHRRHPTDRKRFSGLHGGTRHAVTNVTVLERFTDGALHVEARLETGRTHQIRMHLAERGCPLLADPLYGGRAASRSPLIDRLALHAATLGFVHPDGRTYHFESPLPDDFARALDLLRKGATWRT
ncbi:MAG: RluA family pseudouridine synthase [Deltaproteobacteria bacterium]|nr:MAG: RluA family pseudouridine synthase [Deltaproteobacteria bacterium]